MFVILNEKYFEIVQQACSGLRKPAQYCAAKLIHYFANWAQWKKKVQRTEWIYQKLKDIKKDLLDEHSLHQIREAIESLIKAGILERRNNPGNFQDKTYQYKINLEKVHYDARKDSAEISEFYAENTSINVENQTENLTIESNNKIPSIQREEKKAIEEMLTEEKHSQCTPTSKVKKTIPAAKKNLGQDKCSEAARQIFKKYEDRLKLYGIRSQRWDGVGIVPEPKMESAIANLSYLPPDIIEAGVRRFLGYIGNEKNVRDAYALMVFEIKKGEKQ